MAEDKGEAPAEDKGEARPLEEGVGRLVALHMRAQVEATKPERDAVGGADRQQQHGHVHQP